jgi:predicted Zn-dependent protease
MDELIRQSLHYLIIHEIGHTLGLMHNMGASSNVAR